MITDEAIDCLKAMLLEFASSSEIPRIVLTSDPSIWIGANAVIVDVSILSGESVLYNTSYGSLKQALNFSLYDDLIAAGWTEECLIPHFLSEPVTAKFDEIGITITNSEKQGIMAIIRKPPHWLDISRSEPIDELVDRTSTDWVCLTDGLQYLLRCRRDGRNLTFTRPPRPEDIGRQGSSSEVLRLGSLAGIPVKIRTLAHLRALFEHYSPCSVIVDFTISNSFMGKGEGALMSLLLEEMMGSEAPEDFIQRTLHDSVKLSSRLMLVDYVCRIKSVTELCFVMDTQQASHNAFESFRNSFSEEHSVRISLSLPDLLNLQDGGAVVLFGCRSQVKSLMLSIGTRSSFLEASKSTWWHDAKKALSNREPQTGSLVALEPGESWEPRRHSRRLITMLEQLKRIGNLKPLKEVATVTSGLMLNSMTFADCGVLVLNDSDIVEGAVSELHIRVDPEGIPEEFFVSQGDIVGGLGLSAKNFALYSAPVSAVASGEVIIVRSKSKEPFASYLVEYLNSEAVRELIQSRAQMKNGRITIDIEDLQNLPTLVPGERDIEQFAELHKAGEIVRAKLQSLSEDKGQLFFRKNANEFFESTRLAIETVKALSNSLGYVDQMSFRIANFYPFPLAYPYRAIESTTNVFERYKEQLRVIENILAFIASVSLVLTIRADSNLLTKLKSNLVSGISAGHWRELIRSCMESSKKNGGAKTLLSNAISGLRIEQVEKGFGKNIETLIRARNDFAHHRGPTTEGQVSRKSAEVSELLQQCMSQLGFFADYPIWIVKEMDVNRATGLVQLKCLKAIGDHPALPQSNLSVSRAFPKNELILDPGDGDWITLFPFLSQSSCSVCGSMETYFFDKLKMDKNLIQLKSFERGHCEDSEEASVILTSLLAELASKNSAGQGSSK
ncbi:MAG: hypothetical protein K2X77_07165 [Candidatus Obscuribacterales bacterium]|nr:hypothetical protein [Candidatus Obscuribacterales bacterium]